MRTTLTGSRLALAAAIGGVLLAAGAIVRGQAVKEDPARAADMRGHFDQVTEIHAAVIRGDLPAVQQAARGLEGRIFDGLPAPAASHVEALQASARRAAAAQTVEQAANEAAGMLATCGACHRAVGTMPAAAVPDRPQVGGIVGHMIAHQRALDEMMQGLVVPSTSLWQRGARALLAAPMHRRELPPDPKLTDELVALEDEVHEIAELAVQADTLEDRTRLYGRIAGSCAGCHSLHGRIWGPGR